MASVSMFSRHLGDNIVQCSLCPHQCKIPLGKQGICRTRYNDKGTLKISTHGRLSAAAVDPIEKKPLFHFRPGSETFSIASAGCNLVCPFCQNHTLSQRLRNDVNATENRIWTPNEVVETASANNCASISFTYSEPVLSIEFAAETAEIAKQRGVEIVFVTNGQVSEEGADLLGSFLAAANVDLKCFSEESYRKVLGGELEATCRTIEKLHRAGVWVEVTTLAIPGFNDSDEELARLADFIAKISTTIPWHISRFHPDYKWMDRPPTSKRILENALNIGAAAGLAHVYIGNMPGSDGEKTRCNGCGKVIIGRRGYRTGEIQTREGRCLSCGEPIAGVGFP